MIALDTNVLVRLLVRDDEEQFARAARLIRREAHAGEPAYISLLVLLETEWVLRSRYKLSKPEILATFAEILSAADARIENEGSVEEALATWEESTAQFADCLIGAHHRTLGCSATATFDAGAVKLPGFVTV